MGTSRFLWFILAACILSAAMTLIQLLGVYMMSLAGVPQSYESFNAAIASATDIEKVKMACSMLTQWDEQERAGRVKLMLYSPLIALLTSVTCAGLAVWALAVDRRARKSTSSSSRRTD